ncbi:ABC transporter permease [Neobacillus sp. K501]
MLNLWFSEWKIMTRQRSYYSFLLLWVTVFSLLFLLEGNNRSLSGYTNITGTIVNIILYLLPLFMMIIGSFSITNEFENGQWDLLFTYPISIPTYLYGKFTGLFTAQAIIFTLSFGISMAIGLVSGIELSIEWLLGIYLFSLLLIFIFLILGIFLGSLVKTRWKALTMTVATWFFLIMIWPTALIAVLGLLPYPMIEVLMKVAMMLNPAEFLRVFLISKWDSGSIFGQSYDSIVQLFQSGVSWFILLAYLISYHIVLVALSFFILRRRQLR